MEELEVLRGVGAQKICEQTHIPLVHVQAILHESYEGFTRVQFVGFISILEREYGEDLSLLKEEGLKHFDTLEEKPQEDTLFMTPKVKRDNRPIYVGVALFIFSLVLYQFLSQDAEEGLPEQSIDNTLIESVQENIKPKLEENATQESILIENNASQNMDNNLSSAEKTASVEPEAVEKSFKIVSKGKVWMGYIDVATHTKYQGVFKGEKSLDPDKIWLLLFGHGYIEMYVNGKHVAFPSHNKLRFLYKDGEVKAITLEEFKRLNRGRKW